MDPPDGGPLIYSVRRLSRWSVDSSLSRMSSRSVSVAPSSCRESCLRAMSGSISATACACAARWVGSSDGDRWHRLLQRQRARCLRDRGGLTQIRCATWHRGLVGIGWSPSIGCSGPASRRAAEPSLQADQGLVTLYAIDTSTPSTDGEYEATVSIESAEVLEGHMPRRARTLVSEWAAAHRDELEHSWELARASQPLPTIEGLE